MGNKTTTLTLQLLGCDVSAIHTVNFSNHVAYRQFTGRRVPAQEIADLYSGLCNAHLTDFDLLLSGYTGSADAVRIIGEIARDLKQKRGERFFWILDPVMGDAGHLYVAEDIPDVYRELCKEADLILPNAFELEKLAQVKVDDLKSTVTAIGMLHKKYGVRHIVVTSMRLRKKDLPDSALRSHDDDDDEEVLAVVGSSSRSDGTSRPFVLSIPLLPVFFSGTGDIFAALIAVRFHEASKQTGLVRNGRSWAPSDDVEACELPLAKATEIVLSIMYDILVKAAKRRDAELNRLEPLEKSLANEELEKQEYLRRTKASEVRVVRFAHELQHPPMQVDGQILRAEDVASVVAGSS